MLLSGTLADLDLVSIAAMTSLGRTSLRLELRTANGALIGSLVLKAGRVVSATAGTTHGRDALRLLMNSSSDVRFQLAQEPLEFAMSSAIASVDELRNLKPGSPPRRMPTGSEGLVTRTDRPVSQAGARPASQNGGHNGARASRTGSVARAMARIEMMQGQLDEFDLLTLLQTIGLGRQLVEIEIRDRSGAPLGMVGVKSGKVVMAQAGAIDGVDAIAELLRSSDSIQFAAFRVPGDVGPAPELASVADISIRFAEVAPMPAAPVAPLESPVASPESFDVATPVANLQIAADELVVMEGQLADFDVRTLLEVLAATRQRARLQILAPGQAPLGELTLKAGWIVSAQAGTLYGREALAFLLGVSKQVRFRVLTGGDLIDEPPLGSIRELLTGIVPTPPRVPASTKALRWAIPVSFLVGGLIVFLVIRGERARLATPARVTPAEQQRTTTAQGPTTPPPVVAPVAPPATETPTATAAPSTTTTETTTETTTATAAPSTTTTTPPTETERSPTTPTMATTPVPPSPSPSPPTTLPPPAAPIPANARIRNAQSALKRLGYDPGPVDNVYGRRTRTAIIAFQRSQHLMPTGYLDQATWSALVGQLMP
jgi:Putative peptidoglycan binding domain